MSELPGGEPVTRIGLQLELTRGGDGLQLECRCGHVFGTAGENWKEAAAVRRPELPDTIVVHDDLELVEYLCPACGTAHAVEIKERGEPPLHDIELKGDWNG
ncbi:MAG: acetone carboxylase subunit gamma [Gaiella sp.]|nr:acetone carboxylase subunit gamma [Gaiella sp.]